MSIDKQLLMRNNQYDGVRTLIVASQSGTSHYFYSEAKGDRYYLSNVGSTASASIETVTFQSFMSFTMSNASEYVVDIIPMQNGDSVLFNVDVEALNSSGSKGLVANIWGGYRCYLNPIIIGKGLHYTVESDFNSVGITFSSVNGSIQMLIKGEKDDNVDMNIIMKYTKSFHNITKGGSNHDAKWYPKPPIK